MLTRDDILKAEDMAIERVDVPEWSPNGNKKDDAFVFVRNMTGRERDAFEKTIFTQRGKKQIVNMENFRAKLFVHSVCDDKGELLFTDGDVKDLSGKSAAPLQRVFDVASRLSGISSRDVEELTEELEESPFDDSASD